MGILPPAYERNQRTGRASAAAVHMLQSCPTLRNPMDYSLPGSCPWEFPGKSTGVGCHALLQEIFPTQGSNLCLPVSSALWANSLPTEPPGLREFEVNVLAREVPTQRSGWSLVPGINVASSMTKRWHPGQWRKEPLHRGHVPPCGFYTSGSVTPA